MNSRHNPYQGKWTVKNLLRQTIKASGGEMPVEDLLNQMKRRGYLKEALRPRLKALDVDVINGMARVIG